MNGIDAGLLRFCLEHSDGGNLTESQLPQRDEADYKWLREALNNLETDVDRMKKLVEMLQASDSSVQDKVAALEELQYLIEDIDNANDLHKIGGFEPVLTLMNAESEDLRYWATWAVAASVQNNPWSQAQAFEKGALTQIMLLLQNETQDRVLSKAVPALSGLIRDHPKAVEAFLKANGLRLLAYLLTSTKGAGLSQPTRMKVVFLLTYLCRVVPLVRHAVREYSLLQPLIDMITAPDASPDLREKALGCLIEATKDMALNVEACRELGLLETLKARAAQTQGDEDQQTEHDLCRALLDQLSNQTQRTNK